MKLCPITTNYSYSIYRQPNFNGDKKSNDNDNKYGNYKMTIAPGQKKTLIIKKALPAMQDMP